jgi:hypothetical protein
MKPTEQVLHLCAVSGWAARSGLLGTMVNGQLKGLFRESAPLQAATARSRSGVGFMSRPNKQTPTCEFGNQATQDDP